MKILKAEKFPFQEKLLEFVAKNNIQREDIFTITQGFTDCILYYYALS
jgi:hypothetical protein